MKLMNACNVKHPFQMVVPDGSRRPILKHFMEIADHNVFFNVDAVAQTRRKMFLKVIDDVMEHVEEIMKLLHLMRVLSPFVGAAAVYALLVAHPCVSASLGDSPALTYGSGFKDCLLILQRLRFGAPLLLMLLLPRSERKWMLKNPSQEGPSGFPTTKK